MGNQIVNHCQTFKTLSAEETVALGKKIGKRLSPGSLVALTAPLGAGKSCFVKGVGAALEIDDPITSPTYTLAVEYRSGKVPLYHLDVYRIGEKEEFTLSGLEEYLNPGEGVTLIEWAEKIEELLPPATIRVSITIIGGSEREITVDAPSGIL